MKVETGYIIASNKSSKGFWYTFFVPNKEILSFFSRDSKFVLFDFCEILLFQGRDKYFLSETSLIKPSPIRKFSGNLMVGWYFSSLAKTFSNADIKELYFIESAIKTLNTKQLPLDAIEKTENLWLQISGLGQSLTKPYDTIKQFFGFSIKVRDSIEKDKNRRKTNE